MVELDASGKAVDGVADVFVFQGQSWGHIKAIIRIFSSLEKHLLDGTRVVLLKGEDWGPMIGMVKNAGELSATKWEEHLFELSEGEIPFWLATL